MTRPRRHRPAQRSSAGHADLRRPAARVAAAPHRVECRVRRRGDDRSPRHGRGNSTPTGRSGGSATRSSPGSREAAMILSELLGRAAYVDYSPGRLGDRRPAAARRGITDQPMRCPARARPDRQPTLEVVHSGLRTFHRPLTGTDRGAATVAPPRDLPRALGRRRRDRGRPDQAATRPPPLQSRADHQRSPRRRTRRTSSDRSSAIDGHGVHLGQDPSRRGFERPA